MNMNPDSEDVLDYFGIMYLAQAYLTSDDENVSVSLGAEMR